MQQRLHWIVLFLVAAGQEVTGVEAIGAASQEYRQVQAGAGTGAVYVCPMHPDVTASAPGTCPRCAMTLSLMDPFDAREYLVDVASTPGLLRAGERSQLRLPLREP